MKGKMGNNEREILVGERWEIEQRMELRERFGKAMWIPTIL